MVRIFKNLKKTELVMAVISIVFIVAQVWLDLKLPDYMSEITMLVQTPGSVIEDILAAGGKMLLCALGSLVCTVVVAVFAAKIATNFGATLRGKIFDKVQDFSMQEIAKFSTASLITRSTNDVTQVQMLIVMGLQAMVKAPIMATWAIIKIYDKSWQWTMSTAVAVCFLFMLVFVMMVVVMPKFKVLQSLTDDINRVARENLTGLNVVRAYNAEEYQENKFKDANDRLTNTNLFVNRSMSLFMPTIQMTMNGLSLAIYWIGAVIINQAGVMDKITLFSDMIVFSSYAMQVVMSFMMLVVIFIMIPRASVAANRILEVYDTEISITDGNVSEINNGLTGEIEFKNVSFKYPDAKEYVLENMSFVAHKGETLAIIGSTGCGKSSVINLIPRFYDVTEGEVLVDGVNVKDYTQQALRNKIGYVSQKALMFSGDIKSNVAYGDRETGEASEEEIKMALDIAQATEFVNGKESGIDSVVAQGGSNFSGGQKQRLSIARAICRNPEILIFDDSFSALDYKTDRVLRDALKEKCKDATKIIVAQRIGTIRDADRILVVDDGRIVGNGKHSQLMESCEVYKQIALSQLSKEELA